MKGPEPWPWLIQSTNDAQQNQRVQNSCLRSKASQPLGSATAGWKVRGQENQSPFRNGDHTSRQNVPTAGKKVENTPNQSP